MKTLRGWIAILPVALLCGCFQVDDELTLQPDGSGKVKLTVNNTLPEEMSGMMGMSSRFGGGNAPMYPPVNESEARYFFPPKDFSMKAETKDATKGKTLVVEASFKDVNRLLASPYARAHQLALTTNKSGMLRLQALSAGITLAQAAQMKPEGEMEMFQMPGMEDAQKQKLEMRFAFKVTLPNAVTAANGAREGNSASWSAERAKCKDDEEFVSKLSGMLEATCSAAGLKFSPVSPPRLGLSPFGELAAGKFGAAVAIPDTNRVLQAARFVPYALSVTRSLDLSGEGGSGASQAQLTGAVVMPAELAPQQWGETRLEEAVDAKGNSLMPKEDSDAMMRMNRYSRFDMENGMDDEGDPEAPKAKPSGDKKHPVTLTFRAPDWKVKEIAKVKGSIDLEYLGGGEVIKLSNAVPASLVKEMTDRSSFSFGSDSERGNVTDSRLTELGMSVRVQMAMVQSGMTMLSLTTGGGKLSLVDVQVFDVEGRPWPTTLMPSDSFGGEERSCQVMVAGKPKAPFSLALSVSGVGAAIGVPILVEHIPAGEK